MNLGELATPVLIFGGPYSNLQSVLALQAYAETRHIAPSSIICAGDIVAYCGQPSETVEAIRQWGVHVVMGNCEESLATNSNDCGCGFGEGSLCDTLSNQWFTFANQQLNQQQRHWFSQLPRALRFCIGEKTCLVIHGSVTRINQFLFATSPASEFTEQFDAADADIIIAGHSGIPFTREINQRYWHNAGAIGLPANDGTPRTWFSELTLTTDNRVSLEHKTLHYDYRQAQDIMQQQGLNNGYATALVNGLWPSMDVLPDTERKKQGIELHYDKTVI